MTPDQLAKLHTQVYLCWVGACVSVIVAIVSAVCAHFSKKSLQSQAEGHKETLAQQGFGAARELQQFATRLDVALAHSTAHQAAQMQAMSQLWGALAELEMAADGVRALNTQLDSDEGHRAVERLVCALGDAERQVRTNAILLSDAHYTTITAAISTVKQFKGYSEAARDIERGFSDGFWGGLARVGLASLDTVDFKSVIAEVRRALVQELKGRSEIPVVPEALTASAAREGR